MVGRLAGIVAFAGLLGSTFALAPPARPKLAEGVGLVPGQFLPGRQPDGNTVVFRGKEGLVVFDTGRHPAHSREILDYARDAGQPIAAVVNSHWHLDHISGNPRLRAAYPALVVHASSAIDGAMSGFLARSRKQGEQFLAGPADPAQKAEVRADMATIDSGKAVYPDIEISEPGERELAGRSLRIGLERNAVTAGDVWLYDAQSRILAAGDLVTLPAPFFDTACPAGWLRALADLEGLDFERLVPGHGPVLDRAGFATYRKAFEALLDCAASGSEAGVCRDAWIEDAGPLIGGESQRQLARGLLDYYLGSVLRDAKAQAGFCAGG